MNAILMLSARTLLVLALLLWGASPASATQIVVEDSFFEKNPPAAGGWTNDLRPNWNETNGPNNGNGFKEHIPGFSAKGTNHLGMAPNHNVWQNLQATYQPNTRYTLTVAVGHRNGQTQSGNDSVYGLGASDGTLYLTAGFNAANLPAQTFADAPPLVLDTADVPQAVGKRIRIVLRARGSGRSHFDDIRLHAEPSVIPGAPVLGGLAASAISTTTAVIDGSVIDGNGGEVALTLFWGANDGGITPANWQHSQTVPPLVTGAFSTTLTNLLPDQTWFAAVRATNSAGSAWTVPSLTFQTPPPPPVVETLPATNILARSATVAADVRSSPSAGPTTTSIFYGTTDGGTNASAWAGELVLSPLPGSAPTGVLEGLLQGTTYFFRAFAENAAGPAWAAESLTFTTPVARLPDLIDLPPDGITGSSATARAEVTDPGDDPPDVTLFFGTSDGGTNPADWDSAIEIGRAPGAFARFLGGLTPLTSYYYRSRATNLAGTVWSPAVVVFSTVAAVPESVVINEFHYKPGDESSLEEFIELHNPGGVDVDLSGWSLTDAVSYTFPPGTTLAAGGYVVAAEDPPTMMNRYGVAAYGPWRGKLSSRGETIDLRDAAGVLRDRVAYGVGFPWPTGADGGGDSVELIHPALDRSLAGSWRASGTSAAEPAILIPAGAGAWKYLKGTAEASSPPEAWRASWFDDSAWPQGAAPLGYGVPGIQTALGDMRYNYSSAYFRREFVIPAGQVPQRLRLRIAMDDGCIIWINGQEVARRRMAAGEQPFNAFATPPAVGTYVWDELIIEDADDILFGGTNLIAVHGFNVDLSSSDFFMDLELLGADAGSAGLPTPGARNSVTVAASAVPPQVREVAHSPPQPASGQAVTITAHITDPDGMGPVSLFYQLVDPGGYIRLGDAAYEAAWTEVPMRDDGNNGDAVVGDSVFTAVLPASLQTNRRLVRYRIVAEDLPGNRLRIPYADDEQPNFAYYVYDGTPAWQGAFRPGETPAATYPAAMLDSLPTYTLIANGQDVINSQYNSSFQKQRFTGTFVYDGVVYDHVRFRNRGEASIYNTGKNKWRFYFNRGRRLPAKNNLGIEYDQTWKQFSANACASPWAAVHRGIAGVDEAGSFKMYQLAGLPSPHTHYYHFRVVRGPNESPPAGTIVNDPIGTADGQYAGDFWGLYLAVEPMRGNFLGERGLPPGNIYKIEGNAGDKKEQAPGQPVDSSDWNAFRDAHVNGDPSEAWWRANMDMDAYYTFQAINRLVGNVDLRGGFNHYFYHRSSDSRWVPLPWDLDMMFITKSHWTTSINGVAHPGVIHAHKSILQHPALALEYRNRCREILDLMASDATADGGHIGQLLKQFAAIVHPPGETLTWANADAAMWNIHPRARGTDGAASGQTNHRGNFFRTPFTDSRFGGQAVRWLRSPSFTGIASHEDSMEYFVNYATNAWPGGTWTVNNGQQLGYGYQYLRAESADPAIPAKPVLTYLGEPGFPVDALRFAASAFADPQGAGTFAAREWRIAEVGAPGLFEIDALWSMTSHDATGLALSLPTRTVTPGRTYRVRVRQQDNTGRWSHWSEPVQFAAAPDDSVLVHYWNFNKPAELAVPSAGTGGALAIATGSLAEVVAASGQGFAAANAMNGDGAETHLRINNPLGTVMTFGLPSNRYGHLVARVETRRSGQGAGIQHWSYTTDGITYLPLRDVIVANADPEVLEFDFRDLPATWDHPDFALRVSFSQGDGGTAGNHRFDNFTLTGRVVEGANFPPLASAGPVVVTLVEGAEPVVIDPSDWFTDPEGDALAFTASADRPEVAEASVAAGCIVLSGLLRGETALLVTADDGRNPPVGLTIRVLVYPSAHALAAGPFSFAGWSPDEPEFAYPPHMLFLQSGMDDPSEADLLEFAYQIPHDDYAATDSVGLPYNNQSRTRINGLGSDGISFINTGRGRDLGGALVAIDTRGVEEPVVSWTAGTLIPNQRHYALRLQYRVGLSGEFTDVKDAEGRSLVYHRSSLTGHAEDFPAASLPAEALEQPYVQLLWRYHYVSGESGPRDQLRLDNLLVGTPQAPPGPGSYAWWVTQHFDPDQQADPAVTGPLADANGDGQPNFLKFAFGQPPTAVAQAALLRTPDPEGGWSAALRFRRPLAADRLLYELLASDDLDDWSPVDGAVWAVVPLDGGEFEEVTVHDVEHDGGRRFLRLRVTWLP